MCKWEINKVSTPERIFDKIKEEMAQPVGIVIFGADCEFKNEVYETMMKELQGLARYYTKRPDIATLTKAVETYSAVVVMLGSDDSSQRELRHTLVNVMRNAGAKTVIGIYAKAKKKPIPFGKAMISVAKDKQVNQQIDAIEQSNPTADGLDYFIVVEEEKEE